MAGYSIVCYLLQVKDRHNGNILIDVEGHVIHIDFGFMLSNSPGSINFESAPFKLTSELVDVMGGPNSDIFNYFRTLVLLGFSEVRKDMERIVSIVEMMLPGTYLPCFSGGGEHAVRSLRERFFLSKSEAQFSQLSACATLCRAL